MTVFTVRRGCAALLGLVLQGALCLAQYPLPQTPGQAGAGPAGPGPSRPFGRRNFGMHDEGVHILPPGLWWKDQDLVQRLELTPDQQKRIDDLFVQSRMTLIRMHAGLDEEQLQLQPLLNATPLDDGRVMAEITKIADMRAELFKANARMLLQMRGVLTQAQWTKLQQERPSGARHRYMQGPEGPPHSSLSGPPDGMPRAEP